MEKIGFYSVGFRLVQQYHRETKRALTPEEAKTIPLHNIFSLYVDPMVDNIPKNIHNVLGITPADEKLLGLVFTQGEFIEIEEFGVKILLPKPEVLLATKLISLPRRPIDHKKWKDIADIYSLIWYSGIKFDDLKSKVQKLLSQTNIQKAFSKIEDSDYQEASNAIGVSLDEMKNVVNSFITKKVSKGTTKKDESMSNDKWRTPFNVSFDTLQIITNSIYRKGGDTKIVSLDDITKTSRLNKTAVTSNLYFFKSIKIIEGDSKSGFKFTNLGTRFAKSLSQKNELEIKSVVQEITRNSHLNDIIDYIGAREGKVNLADLYNYVKTEARIQDGTATGNMPPPYSTGTRALLIMLDKGNLLPKEISEAIYAKGKYIPKSPKSKSSKSSKKIKRKDISR